MGFEVFFERFIERFRLKDPIGADTDFYAPEEGAIVLWDSFSVEETIRKPGFYIGEEKESGIYVGDDQIVHYNRDGKIEVIEYRNLGTNLTNLNNIIYVPINLEYGTPIGNCLTSERAKEMIEMSREYNFRFDSCHQFCAGCVTDDYKNIVKSQRMLEELIEKEHNYGMRIKWYRWDWENYRLRKF